MCQSEHFLSDVGYNFEMKKNKEIGENYDLLIPDVHWL